MKPSLRAPLLAFLCLFLAVSSAQAAGTRQSLCLPGAYPAIPLDCHPGGPADYLSQLAAQGITLPLPPFPVASPAIDLTYAPVNYGQVRTPLAPIFGSIEDALIGKPKLAVQKVEAPFSYISYTEEVIIDGKRLYMVSPGLWMTANDVTRVTAPRFQGVTVAQTPSRPFGWILAYLSPDSTVQTKRTPGYQNDDYTGHYLKNHELVWVFQTAQVGDTEWYLVGPDEWIPQHLIARVVPNTTPPPGVDGGRWIEINLHEQTLSVYDNYQLVFATLIASGVEPYWTRPGLFQIYEKLETTPMSGSFEADRSDAYYLEDVPWTMYFDQKRALHGAYWRANLGFPQSHGCVNMSIGDAHWVFNWAEMGDWVYVWDPSGKTPTDPDLYSAGGA